jgi:hypothetical protein
MIKQRKWKPDSLSCHHRVVKEISDRVVAKRNRKARRLEAQLLARNQMRYASQDFGQRMETPSQSHSVPGTSLPLSDKTSPLHKTGWSNVDLAGRQEPLPALGTGC